MKMILVNKQNIYVTSLNECSKNRLTIGKIYDVYEKNGSYCDYYIITNDFGRRVAMDLHCFKTIQEYREEKINQLGI